MDDSLAIWLVCAVVFVAMATGAPVANKESVVVPAVASRSDDGQALKVVAKRAEEMVYYGNQQNPPRIPVKKSLDMSLLENLNKPVPSAPNGEVDDGATMVVHQEKPVEEDLKERAEAARGPSAAERMQEAIQVTKDKVAEETAEVGSKIDEQQGGEAVIDGGENVENSVEPDSVDDGDDDVEVDLPDSEVASPEEKQDQAEAVTEIDMNEVDGDDNDDGDNEDEELASLSNEEASSSDGDGSEVDGEDSFSSEEEATGDKDVEEFLEDLRKEGEEKDTDKTESESGDDDSSDTSVDNFKVEQDKAALDPNYYQTMYNILTNPYQGAPSDYQYWLREVYGTRRRRSPLRMRDIASIRSRRNGHVRRIKRDLPSDWLAYRGLGDPLLSDDGDSYDDEDVKDQLSRYVYANLLNRIANSYGDIEPDLQDEEDSLLDEDEDIPALDDVMPYDDIPSSYLGEYDPEELYEVDYPKLYPEDPYDEYVPSYMSKRSGGGAGYYSDARRKRYFYPAYEEPETHWGVFVPEKRSNYDDAIEKLQRLAYALGDDSRPYLNSLLREYEKK